MHQKTHGIVLHALKYGDSGLIVKIFTKDFGLKSFMIKGFRSPKSNLSASLFLPFSMLEMDMSHKKTASAFNILKDARCYEPLHNIQRNFSKQAIALFVAEVLYKTIADEAPHEDLYVFIEEILKFMNETESLPAVFPHFFLVRYSRYLGLYPHSNGDASACYFNLRDGIFNSEINPHPDFLMKDESLALKQLLDVSIDSLPGVKMGNELRNNLLLGLIYYYKIHLLNFREIKSHLILAEVLRG